jgi:hypothetical protein
VVRSVTTHVNSPAAIPLQCLLLPLVLLITGALFSSCGYNRSFDPGDPHWKDADEKNIEDPGGRNPGLIWDIIDRTFFEQLEQGTDVQRSLRKVSGNPQQALNMNSFDEVPNSSWFTNRHPLFPMTGEELQRGVATTDGPDTSGVWIVFKPKVQGMTPGLWIKDRRGDRYILKFDPIGYPDLSTAAGIITGRFFHAMGYNVPQETIVYWNPDKLRIKDGLVFTDHSGIKRPFTQHDLQNILKRVHTRPNGTIRSLASRFLPEVRGPYSFDGTRSNDPNDWCPHEHRRDLRALYVFSSLVNHWDIKDQNTMDILAHDSDRQFLRHYLLDFASSLGSSGRGPQDPIHGYANLFDLRDLLVSLFTLGLKKWQWEDAKPYEYASVGYFESEIFHPAKWDPIYPNPAFENMTSRDAYWAAKMVMSLRDDDIRTLVQAGQIEDKDAEAYLIQTLIERRDKIGRHWFAMVNPLDNFAIENENGGIVVSFDDLSVEYGLEQKNASSHIFDMSYRGTTIIRGNPTAKTSLLLSAEEVELMKTSFNSDGDKPDNHLYKLRIKTKRNSGKWSRPTLLWVWYHPDSASFQLVGIEHTD